MIYKISPERLSIQAIKIPEDITESSGCFLAWSITLCVGFFVRMG